MEITKPITGRVAINTQEDAADEPVVQVLLQQGHITVELTNIGCAVTAIRTPDKKGIIKNIVAGFSDLSLYRQNKDYLGCVVGRYANRISEGRFSLNGKPYQLNINNGPHHLHGGIKGFSHKIWKLQAVIEQERHCGVVFYYTSADGEEGFPGNLHVTVTYLLTNAGRLFILYRATTDTSTPVNLTNHSYFNLSGFVQPTIHDHYLWVNSERFTEKTEHNTPSGKIQPVNDSPLDFRTSRRIGDQLHAFPDDMGYDHNFILQHCGKKSILKAAELREKTSGRILSVYTDQPAMQLYTANYWDGSGTGEQGVSYLQHGAVALETQAYPDSVNHKHFPNTILKPGEVYRSLTVFEFGVEV